MALDARIAAVSYLNTIPFIYGIEHADDLRARLLLAPPSQCAENYRSGRADIALLPAAAVPSLRSTEVITSYCIGAVGPVRTVVLVSPTPVSEVRRVFLDAHSLTSVQLTGYLAAHRWKIAPEWFAMSDYAQLEHAAPGDAFLLIGDKVFDYEGRFPFVYDLAAEWQALTGLPFAFALWVARKGTPYELIEGVGPRPHVRGGTHLRGRALNTASTASLTTLTPTSRATSTTFTTTRSRKPCVNFGTPA